MKTYEYKNENKTRTVYIDSAIFEWEKESLNFNDSMIIKSLFQAHPNLDGQIVIHRVGKIKDQDYLFLISTPSENDPVLTLKVKISAEVKGKLSKKDDAPSPDFAIRHVELHEQMFDTYKFIANLGVDFESTLPKKDESQDAVTATQSTVDSNLAPIPSQALLPKAQIKNYYEAAVKKCIDVQTLADECYFNIKKAYIETCLLLQDLNSDDVAVFQDKKDEINVKKLLITTAIAHVVDAHQKTKFTSLELSKFYQKILRTHDALDQTETQSYQQRQQYEYIKRNLIWAVYTAAQLYFAVANTEVKGYTALVTDRITGSMLSYFPNLFSKLVNLNGSQLENIEDTYKRLENLSFKEISILLNKSLFVRPGIASFATNYTKAYEKANESFTSQFHVILSAIKGYAHLEGNNLILDESLNLLEQEVIQKSAKKEVESLLVDANSMFAEQVAFTSDCANSLKAKEEEVKVHVVPVRTLQAKIGAQRDLRAIQEASSQSAAVMGAIIQGGSNNPMSVVDTADVAHGISTATDAALQAQEGIRSADPSRVKESAQVISDARHQVEDGSQRLQVISHKHVVVAPAFPHTGKIATPIVSSITGFGIGFGIGWAIGLALGPATMGISVLVCAIISGVVGLLVFGGGGFGAGVLIDKFRNKKSETAPEQAAFKPSLTNNAGMHRELGVERAPVQSPIQSIAKPPARSKAPPIDVKKTTPIPEAEVIADSWVKLSNSPLKGNV